MPSNLRDNDHQYVPSVSAALPAVAVAEPGASVAFERLWRAVQHECRVQQVNTVAIGSLRRILRELGFDVRGLTDRDQTVFGLRLIPTS